jgi:hypothetical protein
MQHEPFIRDPEFGPVTIYDAPDVFLTQLMDGEASFRSFFNTFVGNDARLSAAERDTFVSELKSMAGSNPVSDAAIDIATNPFVWLGFMTTPGVGSALAKGGHAFAGWSRSTGVLPTILKTGSAIFDNTPVASVIRDITDSIRGSQLRWQNRVGTSQVAVEQFFGLKPGTGLDPRRIADPVRRRQLEKLKDAVAVKMAGWDQAILRQQTMAGPSSVYKVSTNSKGKLVVGKPIAIGERAPFEPGTYRRVVSEWDKTGGANGGQTISGLRKDRKSKKFKSRKFKNARLITVGGDTYMVRGSLTRVVENRSYTGVPTWIQEMGEGERLAFFREVDETIASVPGAEEWMNATRTAMNERYYRTFFKEVDGFEEDWARITEAARRDKDVRLADMTPEGDFKPLGGPDNLSEWIDEDKVSRLYSGLKTGQDSGVFAHFDALDHLINNPTTRKALLNGTISEARYRSLIRQAAGASADLDGYLPRNITDWYTPSREGLRQLKENELWKLQKGGAPGPMTMGVSDRARSITGTQVDYAPEDIRRLADNFMSLDRTQMEEVIRGIEGRAAEKFTAKGMDTPFRRLDLTRQVSRYEAETARDYAMFIQAPSAATLEMQEEVFKNINRADLPESWTVLGDVSGTKDRVSLMQVMGEGSEIPRGGWSNALALEQGGLLVAGKSPKEAQMAQRYLKETFLPAALGTLHHDHAITRIGVRTAQMGARIFAEGPIGKAIESTGDFGKELVHKFKYFADPDRTEELIRPMLGNTAGYLYSTHLGLNLGSIILNMQQPWLHTASYLGMADTLAGWADGTRFLGAYFKNRKGGFRLTPSQRSDAVTRAFKEVAPDVPDALVPEMVKGLGITDDFLEQLDSMALQSARDRGIGRYMVQDVPLKGFEKVEWLNRATAVFGLRRSYAKAGRTLDQGFVRDATRFVQETQFGSDVLNTPAAFMRSPLLANPVVRQFQTFALRAPLAFLQVGPRVNNGMRRVRGTNWEIPWYVGDPLRALGVSAIVYELGKNLFNIDLSQGGVASSVTEFAGVSDRFLRAGSARTDPSTFTVPAPPAFNVVGSFAAGLIDGDRQLLGEGIAKLIPGGIAFQRALGMLPQEAGSALPLTSMMQKTYADWYNPTPDGSIPVYKADGTLVDYRNPHDLIMRAFGADFGRHRKASDFDHWLSTQRNEIISQRNEFINAILSGRGDRARRIKARFEKKFGFPLTVTKDQLQRRIRNQGVARPERILDRMPSEAKPMYAQAVAAQRARTQVPEDVLLQAETSAQRDALFNRPTGRVRLGPDEIEQLKAVLKSQQEQQPPGGSNGFVPFGSF